MNDFVIENNVLIEYKGEDKEIIIPDGVRVIAEGAFACKNLEELFLSYNIESIGDNVFGYCDKLNIYADTGSYADKYCKELFS